MKRTILIVDDEDDIREVAQLVLEMEADFTVVTAASGADGVDLARRHRPDVILLDVMMRGLDGPATLQQFRADPATRDLPVVFLTARARDSERAGLAALGVTGVLSKPFDPMTFAADLRKLLGW